MSDELVLAFGSYRLDLRNECLWRGTQSVPLRSKPFALLRYLVEQAGHVITKAELPRVVWPETTLSEGILKGYIHDMRIALGDNCQAPQFIEKGGRRGESFF